MQVRILAGRFKLKSPPTIICYPTNLDVQIADRNGSGFIKIRKEDHPYWPL